MPRKPMTREQFQERFAAIRNKQYKRYERGTGSAGKMLESLLGLEPDSKSKADLGFAELKVRSRGAISSIRLFSIDRKVWHVDKGEATQKFGTTNDDGKKRMYFEMRQGTITKTGLKFFSDDESVAILSPNDDIIAEWSLDTLVNKFEDKCRELVVVSSEETMGAGGFDYFVYRHAFHLHGFSKPTIRSAFLQNVITLNLHIESIDIRPNGTWKMDNHGTSFRVDEDKLEKLYDYKDTL